MQDIIERKTFLRLKYLHPGNHQFREFRSFWSLLQTGYSLANLSSSVGPNSHSLMPIAYQVPDEDIAAVQALRMPVTPLIPAPQPAPFPMALTPPPVPAPAATHLYRLDGVIPAAHEPVSSSLFDLVRWARPPPTRNQIFESRLARAAVRDRADRGASLSDFCRGMTVCIRCDRIGLKEDMDYDHAFCWGYVILFDGDDDDDVL